MVYIDRIYVKRLLGINPQKKIYIQKKTAQKIIKNYKQTHYCECCGSNQNLTFHHCRDMKCFNLGSIPYRKIDLDVLLREMRKCDLLCRKCHDKIHNGPLKREDYVDKNRNYLIQTNKILDPEYFAQILEKIHRKEKK